MAELKINWKKIKIILAIIAAIASSLVIYKAGERRGISRAKNDFHRVENEKKYPFKFTIFLSSTYKNLIDERKEIEDALISAGLNVNCMERFMAADKQKIEYIESLIDKSDYLILIIGDRYGQLIPDEGLSYTEYEFDYAVKKDIPILPFILTDFDEVNYSDDPIRLRAFKEKVDGMKTVRRCIRGDLAKEITISLLKTVTDKH